MAMHCTSTPDAGTESAPGPASGASSTSYGAGDLIRAQLGEESCWLEATSTSDDSGCLEVLFKGRRWRLDCSDLTLKHMGAHLSPETDWLTSYPGMAAAIPGLYSAAVDEAAVTLDSLKLETTLDAFLSDVRDSPAFYCDGTGPGDPPLTSLQSALLTSGELACAVEGVRKLTMVQLVIGWNDDAPQPLFRPYVMRQLEAISKDPQAAQLDICMSTAQGGLGLTAIVHSTKDPYKAWAAHLASFGAQASIEAASPFYKLLIGRMLGYREAHILHHIKRLDGPLKPEVVQAVDDEMAALSRGGASLPSHGGDEVRAEKLRKGGKKRRKSAPAASKGFGAAK